MWLITVLSTIYLYALTAVGVEDVHSFIVWGLDWPTFWHVVVFCLYTAVVAIPMGTIISAFPPLRSGWSVHLISGLSRIVFLDLLMLPFFTHDLTGPRAAVVISIGWAVVAFAFSIVRSSQKPAA